MKIKNRTIRRYKEAHSPDAINDLTERHREISLTVRRSMLLLISFSTFCLSVLFTPNKYLLEELEKSITASLIGLPISVVTFIFISPLFLIIITSYLRFFLNELDSENLRSIPSIKKLPLLLSFNKPHIKILKNYLLYFNIPIILVLYSFKISPHSLSDMFSLFAILIIGFYISSAIVDNLNTKPFIKNKDLLTFSRYSTGKTFIKLYLTVITTIPILMLVDLRPGLLGGYNLDRTVFPEEKILSNIDLFGASLRYSSFKNTTLIDSNFSYADISNTNFKNTKLDGADFKYANMKGADFRDSNISCEQLNEGRNSKYAIHDKECNPMPK